MCSNYPLVHTPGCSCRKLPGPAQVGKTPGSLGEGGWALIHPQLTVHTLDSHSGFCALSKLLSCGHEAPRPPANHSICFSNFLSLDLNCKSSRVPLSSWLWAELHRVGYDSDAGSFTGWQGQELLVAHLPSLCQAQLEPSWTYGPSCP